MDWRGADLAMHSCPGTPELYKELTSIAEVNKLLLVTALFVELCWVC